MHEEEAIRILEEEGIDLIASVPCDRIRDLCALLPDRFPMVPLTREEDGVGVCAGAFLAGGRPLLLIQSSGLGNALNALLSLTVTYKLPLPIFASWRGMAGERIPAQIPFNRAVPAILAACGIPVKLIQTANDLGNLREVIRGAFRNSTPYVALVAPEVWEGGMSCEPGVFPDRCRTIDLHYEYNVRDPYLSRADAIQVISRLLDKQVVVANIGIPSKELFAADDRDLNFYMLGSYTQATPIGLGLALKADRDVLVMDGDGSLMGTGILPVIGALKPERLTIVCLDNGTFGSTGNQITPAYSSACLPLMAIGAGILQTTTVQTEEEISDALLAGAHGPRFIHVIIRPGNSAVPDIPLSPTEIRDRLIHALGRKRKEEAVT